MKDIIDSLRNRKGWARLLAAAVIFLAAALPFRLLLELMPGITEIRPANVIPPVLGLIWGPPAAFGIAVGNLLSDLYSGSKAFICAMGFIANFFYAYLPYKLWYSFRVTEDDVAPTLGSVSKILKYVCVILLDSLAVTGILSLIFETAGFSPSSGSYALLFFNNFDFAVLLGVPLLILIEKYRPDYHVPLGKRTKSWSRLRYDLPLFAAAAVGAVWFAISSAAGAAAKPDTAGVLLAASLLLVCFSLARPFNFEQREQRRNRGEVKITIKAKVTIGFLLLAVIFIAFIAITVYSLLPEGEALERWSAIYKIVGMAINIIFAVAIGFLWYVERNIVGPLERVSDSAKAFATRPADPDEILKPDFLEIDTGDEIALLANSFNAMMQDIADYMRDLKTVTAEKERIGAELNVAAHIQASMLPCIFPPYPDRPEFDIYAAMRPAKEVGGDFYDFFLVDENHLAVVIADVSGKGVPAALFMVIAKTLIKNHAQNKESPGDVFTGVNAQLCENNEECMFVTAWMGVLDIAGGEFLYVNAGHNPPLLKRKDGGFAYLKTRPGFVLAGMEGIKYRHNKLCLCPGDILYLYTDGVTEATDSRQELYGEERLNSVLNRSADLPLDELLQAVKNDIDGFVGEAPQFDDITMLALKIL